MDMSKIKRKQKKDGMQLEKDVVRKYNQTLGTKQNKKFNYQVSSVFRYRSLA